MASSLLIKLNRHSYSERPGRPGGPVLEEYSEAASSAHSIYHRPALWIPPCGVSTRATLLVATTSLATCSQLRGEDTVLPVKSTIVGNLTRD